MKKALIIFVIITLVSCKERELGNNYYYLPEYEAKEYLTGVFIYKSFDEDVFNEIIIYPDVKEIKFDDKYIISLQQPNKFLMVKRIKDDLELWNNYYFENKKDSLINLVHKKMLLSEINNLVENKKIEKINVIADSIFSSELFYKKMFRNKYNYYIIQKENDSIFGPLTLKEFEILKKEKKIDLDFED